MKNLRLRWMLALVLTVVAMTARDLPRAAAEGSLTPSIQEVPICLDLAAGCAAGGGSCPYCNLDQCGCASVPGKTLHFVCSCSSIWCQRSCSYT